MKKIGITTTVPVEILIAAGYSPVDLNNIFIGSSDRERLVDTAEKAGFPQNCCTWIKGIYGVCLENSIDTVLCVTSGDCSNTVMLMEVLKLKGLNVISFAYPEEPDIGLMQKALKKLAGRLGTTLERATEIRGELERVRHLALEVDDLTWRDGVVSGLENHLSLVSTSDFGGDQSEYERRLQELVTQAKKREPYADNLLRLAYIGVPPVFPGDLYPFIERNGARVVFNEVQRQFAMPNPGRSLAEQYCNYTYPYSVFHRVDDILQQIRQRRIDGVIHYVQAFCHRGIGDIIFRNSIDLPILTLEGNNDFVLNQHLRTRVEAFIDMMKRRASSRSNVSEAGTRA
ncbi:MAG: 2-hydroxyacyl-CoA dehydratase [Dehalococcoidia bacterium]|nr:MAG: 2-hydroxyacyl-CoA dehydratase [Dehalococcoidia bacterium]